MDAFANAEARQFVLRGREEEVPRRPKFLVDHVIPGTHAPVVDHAGLVQHASFGRVGAGGCHVLVCARGEI